MRSLKTSGMQELGALRRRVVRSYGLERIGKADHDFLLKRLNEVEARIVQMQEYVEDGQEGGE